MQTASEYLNAALKEKTVWFMLAVLPLVVSVPYRLKKPGSRKTTAQAAAAGLQLR